MLCPYCNERPLCVYRGQPGKTCGEAECQMEKNRRRNLALYYSKHQQIKAKRLRPKIVIKCPVCGAEKQVRSDAATCLNTVCKRERRSMMQWIRDQGGGQSQRKKARRQSPIEKAIRLIDAVKDVLAQFQKENP